MPVKIVIKQEYLRITLVLLCGAVGVLLAVLTFCLLWACRRKLKAWVTFNKKQFLERFALEYCRMCPDLGC